MKPPFILQETCGSLKPNVLIVPARLLIVVYCCLDFPAIALAYKISCQTYSFVR